MDFDSAAKIKRIVVFLNRAYGKPVRTRMADPVDELIATVLSQNTTDKNSLSAFALLKRGFRSWDELLHVPVRRLARLIKSAGLANIKAARIMDILHEIKRREGTYRR